MPSRRSLLGGLGVALAAPAIVRTPGLLMPARSPRVGPTLPAPRYTWEPSHGVWYMGNGSVLTMPTDPPPGVMYFNNATQAMMFYDGKNWLTVSA